MEPRLAERPTNCVALQRNVVDEMEWVGRDAVRCLGELFLERKPAEYFGGVNAPN